MFPEVFLIGTREIFHYYFRIVSKHIPRYLSKVMWSSFHMFIWDVFGKVLKGFERLS